MKDREVRDIRHDLGLEEMDDASDNNMSGGPQGGDVLDSESTRRTDEDVISDTSEGSQESWKLPFCN